jgi:hypothetical protein
MPRQGRMTGSDTTVLQESPETMWNDAAEMMPQRSTVNVSLKTAATIKPTEGEIAALAFQLWLDNGCPDATDQEDWLRAEAMLKAAFAAAYESLSRRPSIPCVDDDTEYEILAESRWEGHWETWEREWGGARWVCNSVPART